MIIIIIISIFIIILLIQKIHILSNLNLNYFLQIIIIIRNFIFYYLANFMFRYYYIILNDHYISLYFLYHLNIINFYEKYFFLTPTN
jgi:hypothetical protein